MDPVISPYLTNIRRRIALVGGRMAPVLYRQRTLPEYQIRQRPAAISFIHSLLAALGEFFAEVNDMGIMGEGTEVE